MQAEFDFWRAQIDGDTRAIWEHVVAIARIINNSRDPHVEALYEVKKKLGIPIVDPERERAIDDEYAKRSAEDDVPLDIGLPIIQSVVRHGVAHQFDLSHQEAVQGAEVEAKT